MDYLSLLQKFADGAGTEQEKQAFNDWLDTLSAEQYHKVLGEYETLLIKQPVEEGYRQEWLDELLHKIEKPEIQRSKEITMPFWRRAGWWVAASVILLLGAGYFLFFNKTVKQTEIVKAPVTNDVKPPEINRAMITLANGQSVYLDSARNGSLAMQGNVKIEKLADGQIAYSGSAKEVAYNTLINPRGSNMIDMTLADGSRVWLNAGSSVTYPVAFVGKERKVSVTGEAYFEVAHNREMPFKVSKGETAITVMGTHFNVNAYDDESAIKVTLLEGSVAVSRQASVVKIKPGEQAILRQAQGDIDVAQHVDVEQVMAWKNGYFSFEDSDIKAVMRQLARWYDVEVIYQGGVSNDTYGGRINRNSKASEVLTILERNGVHFKIQGKKIIVYE